MKIDLNNTAASQLQIERENKSAPATTAASTPAITGDRTTLSTANSSVQSLVSQALATPTVRQEKVDALRQSVTNGTYKPDPAKIAAGIIAESGE